MKTNKHIKTITSFTLAILVIFTFVQCAGEKKEIIEDQSPTIFTSTINGGDWNSPGTWTQGIIPSKDSDVSITGRVVVEDKAECLNLMVDIGSYLEVKKNAILKIHHHVIQEGLIVNNGEIWLRGNKVD